MAINMPHEGGLELLSTVFGTTAGDTSFNIALYFVPVPTDDADIGTVLATLTDYNVVGYTGLTGEVATNAQLQTRISVVGQVPQVEFPEYSVTFTDATIPPIYGYGIIGDPGGKLMFREPFTATFTPGANKVLRFIPTMKIGNTTGDLT
jgi:hypothetical protein